ncbi:MAG: Gfo/Idh/MocA family protein [Parvularcula sp.]
MKVAFLGAGYVANMYRLTLPMHPELELVGVYDRERSRSENLAALTGVQSYPSFEALCQGEAEIVLNLTNPKEHYRTTKRLLEAGKHVYTEKPVAMELDQAKALVALAKTKGLHFASAPCTVMSPAAQTLWQAIEQDKVGPVRLIYAEMDDGMVARAPVRKWINEAGVPWPFVDEFETGCSIEHSGYVLTWLCAMFGPVERMTTFADTLIPDKVPGQIVRPADDFSVATLKFAGGQIARLTNGIYAEHDHQLRLFGDEGVLTVPDPRSDDSPVIEQHYMTVRRKRFLSPRKRKIKPSTSGEKIVAYRGSQTRDFCRTIADMAEAITENQQPYVSADFSLHITEVTLACQGILNPDPDGFYHPTTTFKTMEPLS